MEGACVPNSKRRVSQVEVSFDTTPTPEAREALAREQDSLLLNLRREEFFWK